jgi:hypothetical protein
LSVRGRALHMAISALVLGWSTLATPPAMGSGAVGAPAPEREIRARLRSHLRELTRLGPRPSGSPASARAADYLVARLRAAGFEVRLSEGVGRDRAGGTEGRVRNVVGWLSATAGAGAAGHVSGRDALLLASHYDSVVDGPGAADDAASVAGILVASEDLGRQPKRLRPVVVLLSDAEERFLLGADHFVREDPLASRVGAVINFDHAGRAGPLYNFEASAGSRALQEALWSLPAFPGAPRSFSFSRDIYRVLPFDTDFSALSRLGVPGLNFALARDGYAYHTDRDREEDLSDEVLLQIYRTTTGLLDGLVLRGRPFSREDAEPFVAFFPVGSLVARFTMAWLGALLTASLLVGIAVLVPILRRGWRIFLRALLAIALALPVHLALALVVVGGVRGIKGVAQPAYASPWPFFLLLGGLAVLCFELAARWVGVARAPRETRLGAVMIPWGVSAPLALAAIPSSSLFFILPFAGLSLAALVSTRGRDSLGPPLSALLVLTSVLLAWAEPLGAVLPFLETTLPKVGPAPLFFWPGLFTVLTPFLAPLPWAIWGESGAGRRLPIVAGVIAVSAVMVLMRSPYDSAHPQRVWAFHVTAPDTTYEMLASTDRLKEPGETLRPGIESRDLFWIGPGWSRIVRPSSQRSPLPVIESRREGTRLIVEGDLSPGTDVATLVLEGVEVASSTPPASRYGRRTTLRRIVSGEDSLRFELIGRIPPGSRARLLCTTPGVPAGTNLGSARQRGARTLLRRTIVVVEVPLPG